MVAGQRRQEMQCLLRFKKKTLFIHLYSHYYHFNSFLRGFLPVPAQFQSFNLVSIWRLPPCDKTHKPLLYLHAKHGIRQGLHIYFQ
uniref:Uncharacterized protein n=1 Tax=Anguilla anguilla TaxID=7936 RepID=A0A0E9Q3Y4_ANGAN